MSIKEEQLCRLCLKVTKSEFENDAVMKQIFDILLLKLNLEITRDPVICQDCMDVAKKCLSFKYTFIDTEQIILSYSADREEIKHDIKVIYKEREHVRTALDEHFNVCRFCMSRLERNNFASLDALINENAFDMLSEYIVEMEFNSIQNSRVCLNCEENLNGYFKFVLNCLDVEEKIKEYCKKKGTDNMGQVKLSTMRLFLFPDLLKYPDKPYQTCKIEHLTEGVFPEAYIGLIKNEEIDIKDEEMILHMSADRTISPMYKRSLWTYEAKQKSNITSHMLIHKDVSEIKMYKCSICTYEAKQKGNLKTHMLVHKDVSEIKIYKCSICTYEAKQKGNLKTHMLVHKDVLESKMYKCSVCAYEAKQKRYLARHMLTHKDISEIEMYACSLCTYENKRQCNINRHMLLIHTDVSEIKMYKCSLCTYEAKEKRNLRRHMLIHKDVSEIKMYMCSLCTYETKYQRCLNSHMLVHKSISEIQTYKCFLCTYEAKQKSYLIRHMLIHKDVSEIKMYKCSLCTYESKYKHGIKSHMLIHKHVSEIKMYKCSLCTYEAKQKGYLTRHMSVHRGRFRDKNAQVSAVYKLNKKTRRVLKDIL